MGKIFKGLLWLVLIISVFAMLGSWSELEGLTLVAWFFGNGALGAYLIGLFERTPKTGRTHAATSSGLDDAILYHQSMANASEPEPEPDCNDDNDADNDADCDTDSGSDSDID